MLSEIVVLVKAHCHALLVPKQLQRLDLVRDVPFLFLSKANNFTKGLECCQLATGLGVPLPEQGTRWSATAQPSPSA